MPALKALFTKEPALKAALIGALVAAPVATAYVHGGNHPEYTLTEMNRLASGLEDSGFHMTASIPDPDGAMSTAEASVEKIEAAFLGGASDDAKSRIAAAKAAAPAREAAAVAPASYEAPEEAPAALPGKR